MLQDCVQEPFFTVIKVRSKSIVQCDSHVCSELLEALYSVAGVVLLRNSSKLQACVLKSPVLVLQRCVM